MRFREYAKAYAALVGGTATAILGTGVILDGPVADGLTVVAAVATVVGVWAVENERTDPDV